jgi:endonuclease-3
LQPTTDLLFDDHRPAPDLTVLPRIDTLLRTRYGDPKPREVWDPLTQFIYSVLSSRTKTPASHAVLANLKACFGTWENLRDAPVAAIEEAIQEATFPEQKAVQLKDALQQITARVGTLSLEFLAKYRTEKIRAWLEQFPGAGPQTSAAVVNFSTLRRRALCMDAHHLRVTQRLGLTPRADAAVTEERLMRMVPTEWTAEQLDEHHSLIKTHGQQLCTFDEPRCTECPLLGMCPFGKRRVCAKTTLATARLAVSAKSRDKAVRPANEVPR